MKKNWLEYQSGVDASRDALYNHEHS